MFFKRLDILFFQITFQTPALIEAVQLKHTFLTIRYCSFSYSGEACGPKGIAGISQLWGISTL